MQLLSQCDRCQRVGGDGAILHHPIHEMDLCESCALIMDLEILKMERDNLKNWLDQTHLKKLQELESQIGDLEARVR